MNQVIRDELEQIIFDYIAALKKKTRPVLLLPDQKTLHVFIRDEYGNSHEPRLKRNRLMLHTARHHHRVLSVIQFLFRHQQQQHPTSITLREMFYRQLSTFRQQSLLNSTVTEIAAMLRVNRDTLGIVAAGKGAVYGPLRVTIMQGVHTEVYDCSLEPLVITERLTPMQRPSSPQLQTIGCVDHSRGSGGGSSGGSTGQSTIHSSTYLNPLMRSTHRYESNADVIIVLEKDGILQQLVDRGFTLAYPRTKAILITGAGYPSLAVKRLVCHLHTELGLPVIGFFDDNPHGVHIMLQYCYGPWAGGHGSTTTTMTDSYAVPRMVWGGMSVVDPVPGGTPTSLPPVSAQLQSQLPPSARQSLTQKDIQLAKRLLSHPVIQSNPMYTHRVQHLLQTKTKYELQALLRPIAVAPPAGGHQQQQQRSPPPCLLMEYISSRAMACIHSAAHNRHHSNT